MFTLLALFIYGSPTSAMCVHKSFQLVAWNAGGQSALIRELSSGPEGGGATLFYIFDFQTKTSEIFTISSSFSPGDGSEPERIAAAECVKNASAANAALAKRKFKIKLDTRKCKSKERVLIASTQTAELNRGGNSLTFKENASCAASCRWSIEGAAKQEGACF